MTDIIRRPDNRHITSLLYKRLAGGEISDCASPTFTRRWRVAVGDFVPEGDGAQAIDLNTLFPGKILTDIVPKAAYLYLHTPFAGGSVSAITANFGHGTQGTIGADGDGFIPVTNIFTGQSAGFYHNTTMAARGRPLVGTVAATLTLLSTDGNIDDLTAGELSVFLEYTKLPELPAAA